MVITTQKELSKLINRLQENTAYVYPVTVDSFLHNIQNRIALLHFLFDDGDSYTVSINHPDAPHLTLELTNVHKLVTLYKKDLLHLTDCNNVIDLSTLLHLNHQPIPSHREYYTMMIHQIKNQFKFKNLHYSIPLTCWIQTADNFLSHCRELYQIYKSTENSPEFTFINNITIPTLTTIEKAGLTTTDGIIYSDYNIYTSTGRPSNAFNGVNFAALNKHDGSREKFISRFGENGVLVQFDYEAFHLRLAGKLMKYTLPMTSLHTYLAQQYYGTDKITEEQYNESKALTFSLMYGQTDNTHDVEFFQQMKEYTNKLWQEYNRNGYIFSSTGRKIVVPDPNQPKVFNYLMQLTETEEVISRVNTVCNLLSTKRSKVILYTYDAILLDVHNDELSLMNEVKTLLSTNEFPVREYRGNNYNNLELHKI